MAVGVGVAVMGGGDGSQMIGVIGGAGVVVGGGAGSQTIGPQPAVAALLVSARTTRIVLRTSLGNLSQGTISTSCAELTNQLITENAWWKVL